MNEKLLAALDHISDDHLTEALRQKRKKHYFLKAAAAVLALVFLFSVLRLEPAPVAAVELVSPAEYAQISFPSRDAYEDYEAYKAAQDAFLAIARPRSDSVEEALGHLRQFWDGSFREFTDDSQNNIWSPINTYMALAMLAQTTSGSTRQEILDTLGASSIEALRTETKALWETIRQDKAGSQRLLANSLWLDQDLQYHRENLDILGTDFYASVHQAELDSSAADADIQKWINDQTAGLLEGTDPAPTPNHLLTQRVLTLVSTLYVEDSWQEAFQAKDNTEDLFHSPNGDITCTYLNGLKKMGNYYDGDGFTTVGLSTDSGPILWLILPDEGSNVDAVLEDGSYLDVVLDMSLAETRTCQVAMPKFDVSSSRNLTAGLKDLGIQEAFSPLGGDFSGTLMQKGPIFVDSVTQSARIIVDETGLRAASATRIEVLSKGESTVINFRLDRPFLFVLTVRNIPLFAGVVNEP